jgi:hypothetical protein
MVRKSKVILGSRKKHQHFSKSEKFEIIEDYLGSGLSKREIWEHYTGQPVEHGHILRWMRRFGYSESDNLKIPTFASSKKCMPMKKEQDLGVATFELLQLRKRVVEL